MENIDTMLARHEERHGERNGELLGVTEPHEPEDPLVKRAKILVKLSGGQVRTSWPVHARYWNDADRAERREWVRQLYGEQGLAVKAVVELLGNVSEGTVHDDVNFLGIQRGRVMGKDSDRARKTQDRVDQVRQLYAVEGRSAPEIAERLGSAETTIHNDIRMNGLVRGKPRLADKKIVAIVDRAVTQLASMAQLLLDQDGLSGLVVESSQAQEWEKQLKIVGRAVGRVRRTMKGEP